MKTHTLIIAGLLAFGTIQAQEISKSEVPSVVLNNFNTRYPKATEVDWNKDGDFYRVDFEIDWNMDHEIWYDTAGNMTKHREEIERNTLPAAIVSRISTDFRSYGIDDAEKVTTTSGVFYILEIDAFLKEEWKVKLDKHGTILDKWID